MKQLKLWGTLFFLLFAFELRAQVSFTATYDLSGSGNDVSSYAYNGAPITGLSMGNLLKTGITSSTSMNNFRGATWPTGATDGSDVFIGSVDLAKYIQFSMTPGSGYLLTIQTIQFGVGRSGTGPRQWQWRGSHNTFASAINSYSTLNPGLTNTAGVLQIADVNTGFTGNALDVSALYSSVTSAASFRLYGINAEATGGTSGLQGNLTITGTLTFDLNPGSLTGAPFTLANCLATGSGTIDYTSSAVFLGNTFTVQLSDGLGNFDQPWVVGTTVSDLSNGTLNFNLPAGLPTGAGYRLRILSSNPAGTGGNSTSFSVSQSGISCISSPTDFFRSTVANGVWSNASSWESSSDGSTFISSTLVPGSSSAGITIRSTDSINISSAVKSRNLSVQGALATLTGGSLEQFGTSDFLSGSRYHHARNGGQIPAASWNVNALTYITGITNLIPTQLAQSYGFLIWDNPGQTQFHNINNASFSVSNVMDVRSTGSTNLAFTGSTASSFTYNINNYRQSGGTVNLTFLSAAGLGFSTLIIPVGLTMTGGTLSFGAGTNNPAAPSYVGTIQLGGNLSVDAAASFRITGSGANQFGKLNFTNAGTQTCQVNGSTNREKVDFEVLSGSTTSLLSGLGTAGLNVFTIASGGILDAGIFQFSGGYTVTNNGTLRTGNANGLLGALGTIGTGATLSTLPAGSTIEYNRAGDQTVSSTVAYRNLNITGSGIKTSDGALSLSASTLLVSSVATLRLTGASFQHLNLNSGSQLQIDAGATFDNGGESQVTGTASPIIIVSGRFITRDQQGFTGTNTAIPGIIPTLAPGCTIEYGRVGDQTVQDNADYQNLVFSGSGTKTATTTPFIIGTVTISDDVILEVSNNTFGGAGTNLTMTGNSRMRVAGTGVKPDIQGTYTLSNTSTIEFYNNALTLQSIRLAPLYGNMVVNGSNVGSTTAGSSLTFQTGSTFTVQPSAVFKLQNTNGFSGAVNTAISSTNSPAITLAAGSTIEYNATANQTISTAQAYQNLVLSGTSNKTLNGNISLNNLTLNGTVVLEAIANTIQIAGNWTSNTAGPSFSPGLGKVEFNGSSAQQIIAVNGNVSFDTLLLNNSSSTGLTLNNTRAIIERRFNLLDGILFAPDASTARVDMSSTSLASEGSSASYVDGWISKSGTDPFNFPTGSDGYYAPIGITAPTLATDQFMARYQRFGNPYDITSKDAILEKVGSCEHWDLDRTNGTASVQVVLSYDYVRSCGIDVEADLRVARWDGSSWKDEGLLSINTIIKRITSGVVSSFSPFTLGSTTFFNPLPLDLLDFQGKAIAPGKALIQWQLAQNAPICFLERSYDGKTWQSLGTGSAHEGGQFSHVDDRLQFWTYYRLSSVTNEGRSMSPVISVNDLQESRIQLAPNPCQNEIRLISSGGQKHTGAKVSDMMGKELFSLPAGTLQDLEKQLNSQLPGMSNGTYLLNIQRPNGHERLIFQVLK
jgi:hypothetical protein